MIENAELIAKALDMYEQGEDVNEITSEVGLQKKEYKEFITNEMERKRKENRSIVASDFPSEWDKARFKLLGVKK